MSGPYWIDKDEWRAMTDAARVLQRRLAEAEELRLPSEHIRTELEALQARLRDPRMLVRGLNDNPSWMQD